MIHWLSVVEYATLKKVSVSTLRRKIKSKALEFKIENGRYLIKTEVEAGAAPFRQETSNSNNKDINSNEIVQELLAEVKRAYGLVLTEKEELIHHLKSEIEILKQMNQFLEQQILLDQPKFDKTPPSIDYT